MFRHGALVTDLGHQLFMTKLKNASLNNTDIVTDDTRGSHYSFLTLCFRTVTNTTSSLNHYKIADEHTFVISLRAPLVHVLYYCGARAHHATCTVRSDLPRVLWDWTTCVAATCNSGSRSGLPRVTVGSDELRGSHV